MTPTSLDNQSGAADDGHIVRIVRLETQMDNVTAALLSLQRTQELHYQTMQADFASLRDKLDDVQRHLTDRQDRTTDRLDKRIDHLGNRIDRLVFWVAGLTAANLATMVGLLLRVAGAI